MARGHTLEGSSRSAEKAAGPLRQGADGRDEICRRIAEQLIAELGQEADDHCLTITYYLLRAGEHVDAGAVEHFASRAADIAYRHRSYFVAGRYYQAAARAAARLQALERCHELGRRAGEAFDRLEAPAAADPA